MNSNFDYEGARKAGYSDEEINSFVQSNKPKHSASDINQKLLRHNPKFDVQGAIDAGYSPGEINEHLEEFKPKRSLSEKAGRLGTQAALGAAENALLPYEIGVAPLASKEAQTAQYREGVGEDIERLLEQKSMGLWDEQDEALYKHLSEQMQDPEKASEYVKTADIGVRGLAEKATGLDLHPEGIAEKAANWIGFIKNPTKLANLAKTGITAKEAIKAIAPSGSDLLRGIGAGTALEMAEQGNFGPIGTMAAVVIGDVAGGGTSALSKEGSKAVAQPKKYLAELSAKFTPKEKLNLQKEIIEDFKKSGLQADLGTLTDSNLIKWTQSRLAQSGLTGKALDEFRHELTDQIKREYRGLAESLGEAKYATAHEAGEAVKEGIKTIRETDLKATRQLYENATKSLKEKSFVDSNKLASVIEKLEKNLIPGSIKSTEQQTVLNTLEKLKRDLYDSSGKLMYADVKELMNNKIALNDIINYEVQGGAKQLLKEVVKEIDKAIISHGKQNPTFAKNYINANKRFSQHAKTFRSREVEQLLRSSDPSQLLNKMNTTHGIRTLDKVLSKSPEGKEIFNSLKRSKLDKAIGDNLVDSATQQVKLGTFSKLLEKSNNKEIFKEILGKEGFKRLERLQKNAGKLASAADKFYNASKSGVVAADAAVMAKGMSDVAHVLMGNPWPLAKTVGGVIGARKLSSLLADPEFLKLAEQAILASEKGSQPELFQIFGKLCPYILPLMQQSNEM
jgi:hypothetical protein